MKSWFFMLVKKLRTGIVDGLCPSVDLPGLLARLLARLQITIHFKMVDGFQR